MIAPLWRGVDRIVVDCGAAKDSTDDVAKRLCAVAIANVERDSPLPVGGAGTVQALRRGDAVLRLRITDERDGGESALSINVERGVVVDDAEGGLIARPVALATHDDAALVAAVGQALDRVLPWRRARGDLRSRR